MEGSSETATCRWWEYDDHYELPEGGSVKVRKLMSTRPLHGPGAGGVTMHRGPRERSGPDTPLMSGLCGWPLETGRPPVPGRDMLMAQIEEAGIRVG
jgi:hypothetical protein